VKTVIVMPTYNEAENLPGIVAELLNLDIGDLSILIIDDNSPDGTGLIADGLASQYPGRVQVVHRPAKLGLGRAYVTGFRLALDCGADYIIEMDADFSHSPAYVPILLEMARDYDVVVGSRYVDGGGLDESWGRWRRILSWWGNYYARLVTGLNVRDTTAGFKCFRREALAQLDLDRIRSDGYAFQIEVAYACQRKGLRVCEIPIFFEERAIGTSKMSLPIVFEAIWRVWQIKFRY
jgi:dolichol-phosphate mannosyltransferase